MSKDSSQSVRLSARLLNAYRAIAHRENRTLKAQLEIVLRAAVTGPETHVQKWLRKRGDASKIPEQSTRATVSNKGR